MKRKLITDVFDDSCEVHRGKSIQDERACLKHTDRSREDRQDTELEKPV